MFSRPRLKAAEKPAIVWRAVRGVSFDRRVPLESHCL
jgi:hypothetical protein